MKPASHLPDSKNACGRAVLFLDTGELGNRLVSYSYLLAFSAEHRLPVTNLCFWRYAHLFNLPTRLLEHAWLDETDGGETASAKGAGERFLETLLKLPGFRFIRRRFEFDGGLVCSPRALFRRLLVALAARSTNLLAKIAGRRGFALRQESQWEHHCSLLVPRELATAPFMDSAMLKRHAGFIRARFRLADPLREKLDQYFTAIRDIPVWGTALAGKLQPA